MADSPIRWDQLLRIHCMLHWAGTGSALEKEIIPTLKRIFCTDGYRLNVTCES